ncbi:MAG: HAD family hydrolase [Gammaproteobacteria bacterium]|nr:MAG: HAD family hydrolase [Gammaproteobacteria bacterium]
MDIRAVSLDLDDTLWPIQPVIERVEKQVDAWLRTHCPEVAAAWPIEAMRQLRDEVALQHPEFSHDFGIQRRLTLQRAFAPFSLGEDWIDRTYEVYVRVRNEVECYADTPAALEAMAACLPLVSISNGTADLGRIGLHGHFRFSIRASEIGVAKPDPAIFLHACERLGILPHQVLHVGDDPVADIKGAREAGMRTAWLNRKQDSWNHEARPDLEFGNLGELAAWLQRQANHSERKSPT